MTAPLETTLAQVAQDPTLRDVLIYLHTEQPDGAEFAALKEALFLHDEFDPMTLRQLVAQQVFTVHEGVFRLTDEARAILTAHPELLR